MPLIHIYESLFKNLKVEACYKHNMKLGLYYSQAIDWEHPHGLCFNGYENVGNMGWGNEWDYPDNDSKDFGICYEEKIKPQVKEILTGYGDLGLIWFDCPMGLDKKYSREFYDIVKSYQPDCLVNERLGNGIYDCGGAGDNEIPEDDKGDMLFEAPCTLNDTRGFKAADQNWKSAQEVIRLKNHLNQRGINYLLNIGPDHLGRFPAKAIDILNEVGSKLMS